MNIQARKKYFTDKITEIGACDSILTSYPTFYKELLELFANHPDAPAKIEGLYDISIRITEYGKLGLIIHTERGEDNISYCSCITKKSKDMTNQLYRDLIYPQIRQFKKDVVDWECATCHTTTQPFHIDHTYPFKKLLEDCIDKENWIQYHKERAILQVLCANCNLKKGSR